MVVYVGVGKVSRSYWWFQLVFKLSGGHGVFFILWYWLVVTHFMLVWCQLVVMVSAGRDISSSRWYQLLIIVSYGDDGSWC